MPHLSSVCALVLLLPWLLSCGQAPAPVVIADAYIKAMRPGQQQVAAYMTLTNNSQYAQAVTYLHSPIAEHIAVQRSIYHQGRRQAHPVKRLSIGPGQTKVLQANGFHLLLFGVYDVLTPGDVFEMTLEFDSGYVTSTSVRVKNRH